MSETREAARERAREIRLAHRKRDRRRRLIVLLSIAGGLLVITAVFALVFLNSSRPNFAGPRNMQSDGIKIGEGFVAEATPALVAGGTPVPSAANAPEVVAIQVYYDYLCPNCGVFEERNGDQLRAWIDAGAVTVEYHPIAVFTAGSQYSLRAANAAACVADASPNAFFAFHEALFAAQPDESSSGYTDDELIEMAEDAGANRVEDCIDGERFFPWVRAATQRAVNGPVIGTDVDRIESTPTIIVNGLEFQYTTAFDPVEFAQFVGIAAGQTFAQGPTPTATATPAPTESASPTPTP